MYFCLGRKRTTQHGEIKSTLKWLFFGLDAYMEEATGMRHVVGAESRLFRRPPARGGGSARVRLVVPLPAA